MFWAVGEGIIIYRSVAKYHRPPMPGELLGSAGIFVLLALLAESSQARPVAVALAAGFDLAAFMNLFPLVTGPQTGNPAVTKSVAHGPQNKGAAPTPGGA
jgi:hypothetical protein